MKIIDLLIKISKGEKVPKKIKYDGIEFEYSKSYNDYVSYTEISSIGIFLIDKIFKKNIKPNILLNDEVEIIEEPKKIEKIARCDDIKMTPFGELYKPTENEEILRIKFNELIDEVNKLKKEN